MGYIENFFKDRVHAVKLAGYKGKVRVDNNYKHRIENRYPRILIVTGLILGTLPLQNSYLESGPLQRIAGHRLSRA